VASQGVVTAGVGGAQRTRSRRGEVLLKEYTVRSSRALAMSLKGKASRQVWFVDAFAGEGYDPKGNPGSPAIAGRITEDLASQFPPTPKRAAPMRILAIELDRERGRKLQEAMRPFHDHSPSLADGVSRRPFTNCSPASLATWETVLPCSFSILSGERLGGFRPTASA
jgi:hypothetical protein